MACKRVTEGMSECLQHSFRWDLFSLELEPTSRPEIVLKVAASSIGAQEAEDKPPEVEAKEVQEDAKMDTEVSRSEPDVRAFFVPFGAGKDAAVQAGRTWFCSF